MDVIQDKLINPLEEFASSSVRLVQKCHKPDLREYQKIARYTAIGFLMLGIVGFVVKLVHIPVVNMILDH